MASPRQLLLSRAFASQAGAYVIVASGLSSRNDYPERYRELFVGGESGDSCILDPRGEIIAGPVTGETILTATVSLEAVYAAKMACDVGGHYSRPDIFQLHVNREPRRRLAEHPARHVVPAAESNGHADPDALSSSAGMLDPAPGAHFGGDR